ncbi:MAG: hypothetical protein P1P73_11425 [Brevefilum sp.]|nr:hypothetical protein [Brevefilum sp.]
MNNKFFKILTGVLLISLTFAGIVSAQEASDEPIAMFVEVEEDLEDGAVCSNEAIHPVLSSLAEDYEVEYDDLLVYFCEQEIGIGEIEHALATADLEEVEETYDVLLSWFYDDGMEWGEIWQTLGLIGSGEFDPDEDDDDEGEDDPEDEFDDDKTLSEVCSGEMDHPVLLRMADEFGVTYESIKSFFCEDNFGIGEIKHALETGKNETVDKTWEELLGERDGEEDDKGKSGWGEIWQRLGLIGKNKDEQESETPEIETTNDVLEQLENSNSDKAKKEKPENHPGRGKGLNKKP